MKQIIAALWCLVLSVTLAAAQDTYMINSGDTLRIEVLEDPTLNRNVLVLPDGQFSFPFAGTIRAGGSTIAQVQDTLSAGLASNFAAPPNVFVSVLSVRPAALPPSGAPVGPAALPTIAVYFVGEIASPGARAMEPGTNILQALSTTGGLTRFAATKRIQLRRTDPVTGQQQLYLINYKALSNGQALQRNIVLQNGDVILVPERRLFE